MEISTAPYLLKILQPKARTKVIQITITSHTYTHTHINTHTHTHTHTQSHHLRITCHQNTHTKRLKIKPLELHLHSLPLSFLQTLQDLKKCSCKQALSVWLPANSMLNHLLWCLQFKWSIQKGLLLSTRQHKCCTFQRQESLQFCLQTGSYRRNFFQVLSPQLIETVELDTCTYPPHPPRKK